MTLTAKYTLFQGCLTFLAALQIFAAVSLSIQDRFCDASILAIMLFGWTFCFGRIANDVSDQIVEHRRFEESGINFIYRSLEENKR